MKGVVYAQYIIQCTAAGVLAHRTVILSPQQVAAFPPKINLEQVKSWGLASIPPTRRDLINHD